MSIRHRVEQQKLSSVNRLHVLTGGLPPKTKFSGMNRKVKKGQLKNFTSAMSRYIASDGRVGVMITLTFGHEARVDLSKMPDKTIKERADVQHRSLIAFLHKMRKSKRVKGDIRYMAVVELQSDGNMHSHIFLSVVEDDLIGLIEFIYDFKQRYAEPYIYNRRKVYPIGRLHIGISVRYKKVILQRYTVKSYPAKSNPGRTEHYIASLDSRPFQSGNWTPVEFYTEQMMRDRYGELISDYLTKTLDGEYEMEEEHIKEGVAKSQLGHDTKTMFSDDYITKLQVRFIRLVGKRIYTHSRLPFPFKLYQTHYKTLRAYDPNCTVYYRCIEDFLAGRLVIRGASIFDAAGDQIAPAVNQSQKRSHNEK